MEKARAEAKRAGAARYDGQPCAYGHDGQRYVSNGGCVQCVKDKAIEHRNSKKAIMSEAEVQALLLRGGPNDKATAEAAGLPWYNQPRGYQAQCLHGIIGVAGACTLCGAPTPEPVEATLAQQLLS